MRKSILFRYGILLLSIAVVVLIATGARADIGDLGVPSGEHSWATRNDTSTPTIFRTICCAADGPPLGYSIDAPNDARIRVRIMDAYTQGIAYIPAERIQLRYEITGSANISYCPGLPLAYADAATDAHGYTSFSGALAGGGRLPAMQGHLRVYVEAEGKLMPVTGTSPFGGDAKSILPITLTSVDLQPDGRINLADIAGLTQDLGTTAPRSDFTNDGHVDLADIGVFARHLAHGCK